MLVANIEVSEFDQQLTRHGMNVHEKPFSGASDPQFYHYFKQYKADAVCYNMLTGVQEAAGMGSPSMGNLFKFKILIWRNPSFWQHY